MATKATKEILGLSIYGPSGQTASEQTTASGLLDFWRDWEKNTLPLDLQGFNRFHHGGKVNRQDRKILSDLIAVGKTDGQNMAATQELLDRQTALKT